MSAQLDRRSARHISSLDGIRGIAFLLVFLRHYTLTSHMTSPLARTAMAIGQGGWIGVDLFFVLSGFLITGILLDTRRAPHYFRNFFARRTLRIFPLYYGIALLLLLLTPLLHLQWHRGHIAYLFYVGNIAYLIDGTLSKVQPDVSLLHLWSLSVEEQFYLVWPCVVFLIARRKHLAIACAGLSAFAFILRAALQFTLPLDRACEISYALLPTHMDALLYGALAALWVRARPLQSIQPTARRIGLAAAAAIAIVYATSGFDFHSRPMDLAGYPVLAALFASVLLQALAPGSWASRLGSLRPLRFLGKYSYGLYIYHLLFTPALGRYQGVLQRKLHSVLLGGLLYDLLIFAGSIAVAFASYHLYEKRWLVLKRAYEYRKPPDPVPTPSQIS